MHRALFLPEIVAAIVRAGKLEPGLLYSCLTVNRLFYLESCRILWKGCYGIFGVGHVTPTIRVLANMVTRRDIGRERAQVYADFIRVLVFQEEGFGAEEDADDARWHPQLRELSFPLLEDLNIWKTESAERLNTEAAILHYVHSGLRDLRVDASGPLSDFFLEEIGRLCPRLQQLDIDFKNVTITKEGLARFLESMSFLEGLHVAALEASWSQEALVAVSHHERLQLLHVPATPATWFDAIDVTSTSTPFPALRYFYCLDTTGKALSRLHSMNPRLQAIHTYNSRLKLADDVMLAISKFSNLTSFRYQPGTHANITGHSLMELSKGCPSLTSLSIGQDQATPPTATDLTDDTIQHLAQGLSQLKELFILFNSTSTPPLSIATTLLSLSKSCTNLQRLEISCGSDWHSLKSLPQDFSFPHLWTITLRPKAHMEECLTETEFNELLDYFKLRAPEWFPKVEYFTIEDADVMEQVFNDYMYSVGYKREYGSETEEDDGEEGQEHDSWQTIDELRISESSAD